MILDSKYKSRHTHHIFPGLFLPSTFPILIKSSTPTSLTQGYNLGGKMSQYPPPFSESSRSPRPGDSSLETPFTNLLWLAKCRHMINIHRKKFNKYMFSGTLLLKSPLKITYLLFGS